MAGEPLRIVILGLSITSSWGNGHATIFRGLVRWLAERGHEVTFLERDRPWYAAHRDMAQPAWGRTILYDDLEELRREHANLVAGADLVMVGSYVPEGVEVGRWVCELAGGVTAFYDIDTPVTVAKLQQGDAGYIDSQLIRHYQLYLSFSGGPVLRELERMGAQRARAFYCCADPQAYLPKQEQMRWDLGYMGTYSQDRMAKVERMVLEPARQESSLHVLVAGAGYVGGADWPVNVEHREHLPPSEHEQFYNTQRFTVNITREDMVRWGWSPSVRLFEAAACATPIVSDWWDGLGDFFEPGREILIAESTEDVLRLLRETSLEEAKAIGEAARLRMLSEHTANHRAAELERHVRDVRQGRVVMSDG